MPEVIRIIAAVVDTQRLTLYREDGTPIIIPQGDGRIRNLVDKVIPAIEANGYCELGQKDLAISNHFNQVQETLGGFVRFFRMFKEQMDQMMDKLSGLGTEEDSSPVQPRVVGQVPSATQAAVNEIMANATPVTSPDFHAPMSDTETLVAVTEEGGVIPGIEKLDLQLQAVASKLGSAEGVKNFFKRLGSVERNHSIADLLTFMEKGELPIADDGSVLVYKRLNSTGKAGVFVDCHSGKVKQRVGSKVFMAESLVDPNRSNECSNGLHVARRDYLGSFSGDVCVLAKLAPEDVIAVPHGDARKLRAKGYHIIAQLSDEDKRLVIGNQPMADKVLLGNAVAGNHAPILETVEITGHYGKGVIITPLKAEQVDVQLDETKQAESLDGLPKVSKEARSVNAAQIAKAVGERKLSRAEKVQALLEAYKATTTVADTIQKAKDLVEFKRNARVSWDTLGIPPKVANDLMKVAQGKTQPKVEKSTMSVPVPGTHVRSPRERLRALIDQGIAENIDAIRSIKREAKKGWAALGVSDHEVKMIQSWL